MRLVVVALWVASAVACSGSEEDGPLACVYERSSTSCSGSGFGPYEEECLDVQYPKDGLTPDGWCDIITSDSSECASSCCLSYRYRNPRGEYGTCEKLGF